MHLREELSALIEDYITSLEFPGRPAALYDPIRYSLEGGGKRVRPLLALLACQAFGGRVRDALPLAAAVEVFHNFTLLHDDVMDNADMRRGRPSVHARWGEDTAILSGDVMMIYAYKLLARSPQHLVAGLLEQFNRMGAEVCEGQQFDMDFQSQDLVTEAEYMEMIALKTAALMARPAQMGAMIAGASDEDCAAMYRFGFELGLAFQLQDDLLDSYSDDPCFGKKVGGDIIEGKKSFLAVTASLRGDEAERERLAALLADGVMDEAAKVAQVRALYDGLDIRALTGAGIGKHLAQAVAALEGIETRAARLVPLRELAEGMAGRKK